MLLVSISPGPLASTRAEKASRQSAIATRRREAQEGAVAATQSQAKLLRGSSRSYARAGIG